MSTEGLTEETGQQEEPFGPDPLAASARETTEGRVYTVTGGDWDDFVDETAGQERVVINLGPQHPSTHGVLRLVLELEGERVAEARSVIG